jgi:hypothetical protein
MTAEHTKPTYTDLVATQHTTPSDLSPRPEPKAHEPNHCDVRKRARRVKALHRGVAHPAPGNR